MGNAGFISSTVVFKVEAGAGGVRPKTLNPKPLGLGGIRSDFDSEVLLLMI